MRDLSGGRKSVSQPFLELPRLRPTKAQRLSDWTINRIAQPRCLTRLGSPELIQKSGDAISRVFAKTLTNLVYQAKTLFEQLEAGLWRQPSQLAQPAPNASAATPAPTPQAFTPRASSAPSASA